jgi:4-amino-4-deoxy-L-arabinose transferase-like glycosyltransferase
MLLVIHAALLAVEGHIHSPTLNEPGHLSAGITNWYFGRFDVYKVNPPLVRMVAAIPTILVGCETKWDRLRDGPGARPEFALGEDFVAINGQRSIWLITLARWACIPFSLIGGFVCYRWARDLYGNLAGLLSLTLWCFCPNILAHAHLITSDAAAAALGVSACYTFWHWLKRPTWWHTLFSGIVLGIAELSKATFIIFYPLWPLMWLVYRWQSKRLMKRRDWFREVLMLFTRMIVCVYVINLGYGFEGSCTRLGDFRFVSRELATKSVDERLPVGGGNRFVDSWLVNLPVPFPKNYVLGIDLQKRDFEKYRYPSYLRGEFRDKGWWYYYLYALAIKVPLGTWLLLILAVTRGFWWRRDSPSPSYSSAKDENAWRHANAKVAQMPRWQDEFVLLTPAVVILAFVSSQAGFSEHLRYALPIFPFAFVWISRAAVVFDRRHWLLARLAVASLAWAIISSLSVVPHSLSYFNELVGGPRGGPNHLIHSNVDWGQDLWFLKRWLEKHPEAEPLNLIYFGYFDPRHVDIEYAVPENLLSWEDGPIRMSKVPPGWYAISVNFVRGFPHFVYKGDGTKGRLRKYALAEFQKLEPIAMAGYSIYIYHVPQELVDAGSVAK